MLLGYFVPGVAIGFAIAAPVGPVGVLCIRRSVAYGVVAGYASGLGAALADAVYGGIAVFGVSVVADFLDAHQTAIRLIGGLLLCVIGLRTLFARPKETIGPGRPGHLLAALVSTFFLTLTNPLTLIAFAAAFAGIGITIEPDDFAAASVVVLGVFTGAALWWGLLAASASLMRSRFTGTRLGWLNRITGAIVLGFGIAVLLSIAI